MAAANSKEEYYLSKKEGKTYSNIINYSMLSRANGFNKYPQVI